jgi:putative ABC transport system permease protein
MRFHRWIVAAASRLVPRAERREWRDEWDAELRHREASGERWTGAGRRRRPALLRESTGALWDALWLQSHRWYSLRLFGRHWRLAATAIVSLAVGIAATTIGLSSYYALMIRPPAVTEPRSLRLIHINTPANPFEAASLPEFTTYRAATRAFSDIAAFASSISSVALKAGDRTPQIVATQVSSNFFDVLRITPRVGVLTLRASPAHDIFDVVISEKLWRTLGADPQIVGTTIRINDQPVTVAGVVGAPFSGMTLVFEPDVWMSFDAAQKALGSPPTAMTDRSQRWLHMVGRLRPDVTVAQAATDVTAIAAGIAHDYPATSRSHTAILTALSVTPPGERAGTAAVLGSLLLIELLTLVVACTNVINLLLGLASSRRHEMLVRAALGASRIQIVVPMVREAVFLVIVAACLGYAAAWALLVRLSARTISLGSILPPLSLDLRPDSLVLAVSMVIALLAGIVIGLPPALRGASDGLSGAINREKATGDPRKSRLRGALILVQMAVATVVLAGVGVSLRSLFELGHVPLGFTARHLVYGGVDLRRSGYDTAHAAAFMDKIRERVAALPGVEGVTLASDPPMMGYSTEPMTIDGAPRAADGSDRETPYLVVADDYFSTLGIPVLQGRTFDSRDRAGRAEVAVVNRTFTSRYFPGAPDPIGRRVRRDSDGHLIEIVGVVADGKYSDIDEEPVAMVFLPLAQRDVPVVTAIARSTGPRDAVAIALEELEPHIVFGGAGAMTLDDALQLSMAMPLLIVWISLAFALIAVAMAVFGLYSTVFYAVSQRRMEIGIRVTLGASPRDLFGMVLRQTGRVAALGALGGLASGLALTPVAASVFYGIARLEPLAVAAAACGAAAIVAATTYSVVRPWTRRAAMDLLRAP